MKNLQTMKAFFTKFLLNTKCVFLFFCLFIEMNVGWGQLSIASTSTITESFTGYNGTVTFPTNWTLSYTGGTNYNGTNQTGGTTGGWYGNNNISFLGSGSASNGNATLLMKNNTGSTITGFTLSFVARMWKSGTASPNVTVTWSNSSTSTNPSSGALSNSLSSLTFSDATPSISTGNTLTQTISNLSIPNGQFIFIRFIHSGGSSSDNLGWDDVSFTPTTSSSTTSPSLSAASSPTVDAPFNVTFTDDPTWRAAITSITVGGTTLPASAYTISTGQITFTPSASTLLQTSGSKSIVVIASNYNNATVTQAIGAGAPSKLSITTQPTAPTVNGGTLATQPKITIQDQYNNSTTSTATISASVGAGSWTIGGTSTINATSGVATFSGLTATSTAAVTGATITFTSTGLTSVTSNAFNIIAPPPSNDLCSNPVNLNNSSSTSGTSISATYDVITSDPYNYSSDVWYSYTSVSSGTISVSLSNSASIDYDLFAYSTNCPSVGTGIQSGGNSSSTSSETMTILASSGTTYYFRVAAFSAPSGSTFTISVNQPLEFPTISSSSNVTCSGFDANWSSVNTATSYKLDVATNNFPLSTNSQGFSSGITAPSGWTFTNIGGTYTSSGNFGSASPSLQMDATNDRVQTPTYSGVVTQLSFWYKFQSGTGSSLLIEGYNGTTWITIQNITSLSSSGTTITYNSKSSPALPSNTVQFRFTYSKSSGNLSFDDVNVNLDNTNYLSGFQDLNVSTTSKSVTGLSPNTKYYYRVRSTDGTNTSSNSVVDSITTPALSLTTDGIIVPFCFGTATSSSLTYTAANDNPNSYSIDWNAAANTAGLNDQAATGFTSSTSGGSITSIAIASNVPSGTYNGIMTITNTAGCSITKNVSLTINALPTIAIAATPSSAIVCSGSNLSLTASGANTYSWSGGISNGTSFSVTSPTTYTVTGTDANGCSATATKTVNYFPAATSAALASTSVSGAVEQCTESDGFTYYADPASPGQYLFGIYKNGHNFNATVNINVDNVNKYTKSTSSNGANQEHASYTLSRYWNVTTTGTVGPGIKVRFFVDSTHVSDMIDARDADLSALLTSNPNSLAVISNVEYFKTVGTTYNPSNWTGNKYNGSIVKLTEDSVSRLNGVFYVALSGLSSFSGGTIGVAFGPSGNSFFNNGGVVGLPVTWKEVNATAKEMGNYIQWSTSSEKNSSHFEVEYSYDAKSFVKASNAVRAAGNSTTTTSYEFTHLDDFSERVYYRIKQIDLDGKIDYSKIVFVKRTSNLPEFLVTMYPIPLNVNELNVKIQTVQKANISIIVNDILGRNVYSNTLSPEGNTIYQKIDLSHLMPGTYYVTIDNGVNKTVQVLLIRK